MAQIGFFCFVFIVFLLCFVSVCGLWFGVLGVISGGGGESVVIC
jgi:hypothetical protein